MCTCCILYIEYIVVVSSVLSTVVIFGGCLDKYITMIIFIGQVLAHEDDINSTCYSGEASQLIYSAGDDGHCKVRGHPSFHL